MANSYFLNTEASLEQDTFFEGVVVLKDLETFSDISGSQVIIFDDNKDTVKIFKDLEEKKDVDIVFDLALKGEAEVISIEKLVDFYLSNN